jgi:uncharacterized membrane protein
LNNNPQNLKPKQIKKVMKDTQKQIGATKTQVSAVIKTGTTAGIILMVTLVMASIMRNLLAISPEYAGTFYATALTIETTIQYMFAQVIFRDQKRKGRTIIFDDKSRRYMAFSIMLMIGAPVLKYLINRSLIGYSYGSIGTTSIPVSILEFASSVVILLLTWALASAVANAEYKAKDAAGIPALAILKPAEMTPQKMMKAKPSAKKRVLTAQVVQAKNGSTKRFGIKKR